MSYLLALQLIRSTFRLHSLCSHTSVQSINGKDLEDDFYSKLTFSLVSLSRYFMISLVGLKVGAPPPGKIVKLRQRIPSYILKISFTFPGSGVNF